MRVGHRGGGTQGKGIIPFDTGALQNSIRVIATGKKEAIVAIGNNDVDYAEYLEFCELQPSGHLNLHKGYVEEFILGFYKAKIAQQLKAKVTATIERGNNDTTSKAIPDGT
jgi:hypothetical protein